ncbi:restriction endonuclease subunit S [Parasutterella secunda]|uniref:restriction endonuclease subunit S n=1 Tax=Parasutterella secunda TaxID=626947 RepID=UPI0025A483F6|nr:restriction endonuclease subunit S [Parasutterella secunda]MDM8224961.1 restriction endonuclease subunit S [Parasutterella secunda]
MNKKNRKPAIRFKAFNDPWEQRKLSSLCSLFTDGDWIESKDQSNFGIRLIQTGNIGITEFIEKIKSRKWISENTFNRLHCEAVFPGDILISRLPDPAGRACIVPNLKEKMITAVDCTIARVDAKFCASFLIQSLSTSNYFSFVNTCLAGGTRQRISRSNLSNYEVSIPSKKIEQKQIGQYFKLLDSLITLHQRKLDKLQNVKKACLEKMFPQNGESVPRIRFKGFTDTWEQRKLGEITNILSASRVHKEEWTSDGVPFFRSSDVVSAFKGNDNDRVYISQELYKELIKSSGKLQQGDILITGGGSIGIPYIVPDNEPLYSKDADLIWIRKSAKHDSRYLYSYFISPKFRDYIGGISHTGTIAHYTIEQAEGTPVPLPNLSEQKAVGNFFCSIDYLITLHQRKLDKLKNLKKACLEKMFV